MFGELAQRSSVLSSRGEALGLFSRMSCMPRTPPIMFLLSELRKPVLLLLLPLPPPPMLPLLPGRLSACRAVQGRQQHIARSTEQQDEAGSSNKGSTCWARDRKHPMRWHFRTDRHLTCPARLPADGGLLPLPKPLLLLSAAAAAAAAACRRSSACCAMLAADALVAAIAMSSSRHCSTNTCSKSMRACVLKQQLLPGSRSTTTPLPTTRTQRHTRTHLNSPKEAAHVGAVQ